MTGSAVGGATKPKKTVEDYKKEARRLGVATTGTKDQLKARIYRKKAAKKAAKKPVKKSGAKKPVKKTSTKKKSSAKKH